MILTKEHKIVGGRSWRLRDWILELSKSAAIKYMFLPSSRTESVKYYPGGVVMINYKQYLINHETGCFPGCDHWNDYRINVIMPPRSLLILFYLYGKFYGSDVIYKCDDGRNNLDLIHTRMMPLYDDMKYGVDVYFNELDIVYTYGCISSGIYYRNMLHFQRCCLHLANISLMNGDPVTISLLKTINFQQVMPVIIGDCVRDLRLLHFIIYQLYMYMVSAVDRKKNGHRLPRRESNGNIYKYIHGFKFGYNKYESYLRKGTQIDLDQPAPWLKELMLDWFGITQWPENFSKIYKVGYDGCIGGIDLFDRRYISHRTIKCDTGSRNGLFVIERDINVSPQNGSTTVSDFYCIMGFGLLAECLMPRFDCWEKYESMSISDVIPVKI
jgi:hypothetical protein